VSRSRHPRSGCMWPSGGAAHGERPSPKELPVYRRSKPGSRKKGRSRQDRGLAAWRLPAQRFVRDPRPQPRGGAGRAIGEAPGTDREVNGRCRCARQPRFITIHHFHRLTPGALAWAPGGRGSALAVHHFSSPGPKPAPTDLWKLIYGSAWLAPRRRGTPLGRPGPNRSRLRKRSVRTSGRRLAHGCGAAPGAAIRSDGRGRIDRPAGGSGVAASAGI